MMSILLEIIKYTLPSLIEFATAYYLMKQYLDTQIALKSMEIKTNSEQTLTSVKLQAYERLTLFLDRIMPYNLYLRLSTKDTSAKPLQSLIN